MYFIKRILLSISFSVLALFSFSQTISNDTLTLKAFFNIIQQNHPVARQIKLIAVHAAAAKLSAKGNFDPKMYTDFSSKNFQGKEYFKVFDAGLKIPTMLGVDLKAGFENNSGYLLDPQNTTPSNGLIYSQISIPLLQGLLIDERRAILRQAELTRQMSAFEMMLALNDLYYKAAKQYFDWQLAEQNLMVYQQAYQLSDERLAAIRRNVELGDRPGIDTVEAIIQKQDRFASYQQALTDLNNKRIQISLFLWNENQQQLNLPEKIQPQSVRMDESFYASMDSLTDIMKISAKQHPLLEIYDNKIQQLVIEKKWKQEKLKPVLNTYYNPLLDANRVSSFSIDQSKWGLMMSFPLWMRKERGELQSLKVKLLTQQYELEYKKKEIENRVSTSINEYLNFRNLYNIQFNNLSNYERLWQSEKKLFALGESSLFMINSREMSYINACIKLNENQNKYLKSAVEVQYAKGVLGE